MDNVGVGPRRVPPPDGFLAPPLDPSLQCSPLCRQCEWMAWASTRRIEKGALVGPSVFLSEFHSSVQISFSCHRENLTCAQKGVVQPNEVRVPTRWKKSSC